MTEKQGTSPEIELQEVVKRHPHDALSAAFVRTVKTPGMYPDGNCLYLVVDPSGAKRWVQRLTIQGRRRDAGLGGLDIVSLASARETAIEYRKLARAGGDPIAKHRLDVAARKHESDVPTFEVAAKQVHVQQSKVFRNSRHAEQWINTLTNYAFPVFGDMPVDCVTSADVLTVLSPIWIEKAETARRVLQRMKLVFAWSKAKGFRTGDNPTEGISKVLPNHNKKKRHFPALPYAALPEFIAMLRQYGGVSSRLAFEFLILNASRTGEVLLAKKSEINRETGVWTIPGGRMKTKGVEHQVPLSARALEIVDEALSISDGSEWLFPGTRQGKHFSQMAFHTVLDGLPKKFVDPAGRRIVPHGFRSTFRDWAEEHSTSGRTAIEMSLSHAVKDQVEAAYLRTRLLEKRKALMESWASYCTTPMTAKVIQMRA